MLQLLVDASVQSDFCAKTITLWQLIGRIILIIRIAIPVVIVLLGTIDLGKAVIAGKEDEIKKSQGMLIRRIIYGVIIFFVFMIVQGIFSLLGDRDTSNGTCWNAVANPNGEK